ncbi:hypothetical protein [Thioalkalivibrio sp. ALE11]|uniref:hypothetical protein n=1 Tax=Thioalkalivibrio sp. ALE11 TaxID=1265494 RepID=UPI0012DF9186|nr:hypothetical protein [Thioalkalivibrio sp. ALE11]
MIPFNLHTVNRFLRREMCGGPWGVFILAIIVQVVALDSGLELYDEGIILTGSERILQGEIPYRDFWTMYAPGMFYLVAGLFELLGTSNLVVRAIGIVAKATIVTICFLMVRDQASRGLSLITAGAILLFLISVRHDAFPVFPSLALALGAIYLTARAFQSGRFFPLLPIAGGLTGLSVLFRHDLGAYTFGVVTLGVAAYVFLSPVASQSSGGYRASIPFKALAAYAIGLSAVILPPFVLLLVYVPISDLYFSLVHVPSSVYPDVRSLPFPGISAVADGWPNPATLAPLAVYLPWFVAAWIVVQEAYSRRSSQPVGITARGFASSSLLIGMLVLACLLFSIKGLVRVSPLHMSQAIVPAMVLIAIGLARLPRGASGGRGVVGPVAAVAVLLVLPSMYKGAQFVAEGAHWWFDDPKQRLADCFDPELPRLHCVEANEDYVSAAHYVRGQSSAADVIYVGVENHERIFVGAVAFYFMAERSSVTKWHELHPGVQTEASIQSEIVREMMQGQLPRFVILDRRWEAIREPNLSAQASGVQILDGFIEERYVDAVRFGSVRVMEPTGSR